MKGAYSEKILAKPRWYRLTCDRTIKWICILCEATRYIVDGAHENIPISHEFLLAAGAMDPDPRSFIHVKCCTGKDDSVADNHGGIVAMGGFKSESTGFLPNWNRS